MQVDRLGFVLAPSPRQLTLGQLDDLLALLPADTDWAAVLVDADERLIESLLRRGCPTLQFHGAESPERCARYRGQARVVKALRLRSATDLAGLGSYAESVDELLLDGARPGSGESFNWSWLQLARPALPFYLAGGLDPENVQQAVRQVRPAGVDVSSGVERTPGQKDPQRLRLFLERTRSLTL